VQTDIEQRINSYYRPKRRAVSSQFPFLKTPIIALRRTLQATKNRMILGTPLEKSPELPCVIARHSSLLYRNLAGVENELQQNKVHNLKLAIEKLNGVVVPPGEIFSFWHQVGKTTARTGYKDGLVLSNGKSGRGIGGGLCQLSNFLFWIFMHADTEIIERYHHSVDAFPDSGRTLPFGSGATVFYNYLDLKIKNISPAPIQIKLWLTEEKLMGQLLSSEPSQKKFHILEKEHCFVKHGADTFRYNQLFRETHVGENLISQNHLLTNFAPVLYQVNDAVFEKENSALKGEGNQ
jgi:vancomycin resistance protein VanW